MLEAKALSRRFLVLLHFEFGVEVKIGRERDITPLVRRGQRRFHQIAALPWRLSTLLVIGGQRQRA